MYDEQKIVSGDELLKVKRQERKVRKTKKKMSLLKRFLRVFTAFLLVAMMYFSFMLSGWYLPQDAFQQVDGSTVQLVNNKILKKEKVRKVIKDIPVPKVPLYMTNLYVVKKELSLLPPVKEVYIRRYAFPARIMIIVKEVTPVISIAPDVDVEPVAIFSKEGRLITGSDYLPIPKDLKTILVLSYGNKGDDYHKWGVDKIKEIQKIVRYVETLSNENVEYIDLRNPSDIYVKIKSVNIRLGTFDEKIYDRISRISSILPQIKELESNIKYVDLSWDKVNFLKLDDVKKEAKE